MPLWLIMGMRELHQSLCIFEEILLLYVDDMLIICRDTSKIDRLKRKLSKSFNMKDLGPAKQILGMKISRDRKKGKLWLLQESYIKKVLDRFNMCKAKPVSSTLTGHLKLSSKENPTSEKEKDEMKKMPYASAVGSLMYTIMCVQGLILLMLLEL
jgi:hypothetical protein